MKKKLLSLLTSLATLSTFSQGGIHMQWHKQSAASVYNVHNNDTVYQIMRIANTSTNNAIAVINLKTESWNYITAPTVDLNVVTNQKVVMKNNLVGAFGAINTTNGWQTTTTVTTLPAGLVIEGATPQGFYGYAQISSAPNVYETKFSIDGATWVGVHTSTLIPKFTKSKSKIYTVHNDLLKVSSNGGSSYTTVNNTYTVSGVVCAPNDDTLYVVGTQIHRSFNGGATWTATNTPSASLSQVATKNGKEILCMNQLVTPKLMYYSNDCGNTFSTYSLSVIYNNETLIGNEKSFYLYPTYKSSNGTSWTDFLPNAPAPKPYDITYTGNVALAGIAQGYFGYSLNKGYNFTYLPSKVSNDGDLMAVKAVDSNTFLAADRKGQVFVSTNQGQTWSTKVTSTSNRIPKKFTVSNNNDVIVLSGVSPHVSFNGGATFASMYSAFMANAPTNQSMKRGTGEIIDVAYLVTAPTFTLSALEVYKTDLTHTRSLLNTYSVSVAQDILDVEMADDNVGYFATRIPATNETVIYKTTNGWATTNTVAVIPSPGFASYQDARLQTFGTNTVIISGSGSATSNQITYYHISTDGGVSWNMINNNFSNPTTILGNKSYRISFHNPNEYIALISNGFAGSIQASVGVYISSTSNSITPASVFENTITDKENAFVLYPNPASEIINIKLMNEVFESSNIKIVNTLGQVVLSQNMSTQDAELNIQHLQSGIYFINLNHKGKTSTAKFIKE